MLPRWVSLTGLRNVSVVTTEDISGDLHPLSRLSCNTTRSDAQQVLSIQRVSLHPTLVRKPVAALPMSFTKAKQEFRVSYASPKDAALMVGRVVIVAASGLAPYVNKRHSDPMEPHTADSPIMKCEKCGRLGHTSAECNQPQTRPGDSCATCCRDGVLDHRAGDACPIKLAFDTNAAVLAKRAKDLAQTEGIFAPQNKTLFDSLFP